MALERLGTRMFYLILVNNHIPVGLLYTRVISTEKKKVMIRLRLNEYNSVSIFVEKNYVMLNSLVVVSFIYFFAKYS